MSGGCINQRPNGSLCGRKTKKESQYCPYHHKKNNGLIKSGSKANMARLLGLSGDEALSYETFLNQHKPHELHHELFQMRALLVTYRKAYQAASGELKDNFIHSVEEYCASYLINEMGSSPEKAYKIANYMLSPVGDAYDEYLESLAVSDDYVKKVSTLIKDIGWLAEKAVKIKDGMTLNLVVDSQDFVDFIQDVVFVVVKDPRDRARLAELTQVWLGRSSRARKEAQIIDAEFEEKEEEEYVE